MTVLQLIFYVFSAVAIFSALMVVSASNPVRGALFLVLSFFAMAGLWILLHAEFLALILVLVYVGAVMTLFLFVVMMLRVNRVGLWEGFVRYLPISLLIVIGVVAIMITAIDPNHLGLLQMPEPPAPGPEFSNTASLGEVLYTHYAFPFEVAAVVLLTAIVAAISLTHSPRKKHKTQNIAEQHAANPRDRLRLVDMPSSPRPKPTATGQ
ncbi:MAG: NADH-quinone oxidoreductase subunit J [Pseudomonadota bacterium]